MNGTVTGTVEGYYYVAGANYGVFNINMDNDDWSGTNNAAVMKVYTTDTYGGSYDDDAIDQGDNPYLPDTPTGTFDEMMTGAVWWFIYLVVMLVPAYILGVFCKMGKWGFLIGLLVGSGLGYAFIAGFPIWLLFCVVLGTVGFIWKDRGL